LIKKKKGIKKKIIVTSKTFIKPERSTIITVKHARPASAKLSISKRNNAVTLSQKLGFAGLAEGQGRRGSRGPGDLALEHCPEGVSRDQGCCGDQGLITLSTSIPPRLMNYIVTPMEGLWESLHGQLIS
jgi:hypothetical protein